MQLSGIYRWAKAQHKDLVYAEGLSEVPSASRWIKFRLLPKLEEALHTSTNKQSTPCSHVFKQCAAHSVICEVCKKVFPLR